MAVDAGFLCRTDPTGPTRKAHGEPGEGQHCVDRVADCHDADQRNASFAWGFLGLCDSLTGGTPMSDLHAVMMIFIGLAATLAVWLGTMGLSFLFH